MRVFRFTKCKQLTKDRHEHDAACYGGPWYIDYVDTEGKRHREVGGQTKRDAEAVLASVKEEIKQGKYVQKHGQKLFENFAEDYISYSKANKKSWERDVYIMRILVPFFKGKALKDISPRMVESYKSLRKKSVAESTITRELACLKHMFTIAIQWGETASNPVKKVRLYQSHLQPMRILSFNEEVELMNASNDNLKPIILTALETGMRKSEILNLKWKQANLQEKNITVEDTKNKEFRIIPISSILLKAFEGLKSNGEYVFAKDDGSKILSFRTAFKKAIKRAGIPHLRFHDLRHTFGSRAVMGGVDIVTVKELMGHKSIEMTMRYSHPTPDHKRAAVELLRTDLFGSKNGSFAKEGTSRREEFSTSSTIK